MIRTSIDGYIQDHPDEIAEVLEKSADLLETDGWLQGSYLRRETGQRCALGALRKAATGHDYIPLKNDFSWSQSEFCAARVLMDYLGLEHGTARDVIPYWNDDSRNTQDKVVDAFKGAAKNLRNGETRWQSTDAATAATPTI